LRSQAGLAAWGCSWGCRACHHADGVASSPVHQAPAFSRSSRRLASASSITSSVGC
jgi:hypothetical protein